MKIMPKTSIKASSGKPRGTRVILSVLLGGLLLFPLGTQAGFLDKALKFGSNLLATAAGNYTKKYAQDLTQLLQALRNPGAANQPIIQGITPDNTSGYPYDPNDPYAQQGNPQDPYGQQPAQPGYPNDPYAQQGYPQDPYGQQPAQQGYPQDPYQQPTQPGYSNDPYGQQPGQQGYPNDPYAQQGYPQDPYGQQPAQPGYPQNQTAQSGYSGQDGVVGTPIGLDVAMVKKTKRNGAEIMIPIKDGDILKDGRGDAQAGDKFRIMFRANTDCYVYIIAIDGSAWAQGIFPSLTSPFANPVKQGQEYIIPENSNWLSLDQFKGIETIFFVASPEKRQDIEDILANIAGKERHPQETPQQVTQAPIIPAGFHRSQMSTTPFIIGQQSPSPQGQDQGLIPTTYFTKKAGEALRVTRWFRHE